MTRTIGNKINQELVKLESDISTLAHDLRTPLGLIVAYAELLATGKAGPLQPKQSRYVNNIRSAARQISDRIKRMESSSDTIEVIRDHDSG
jgi:signal transduction histidine kinase